MKRGKKKLIERERLREGKTIFKRGRKRMSDEREKKEREKERGRGKEREGVRERESGMDMSQSAFDEDTL